MQKTFYEKRNRIIDKTLFLIYHVKSFRELTNFFFYMVGTMVMVVVLGISGRYLNNEMGFCGFRSKEKAKNQIT